jgi:site-specific recombinase
MLLTKKNSNFLETAITRVSVIDNNNREEGLQFLIKFFNEIRPGNAKDKKNPDANLQQAIRLLHEYPLLLTNLRHALFAQLINTDITLAVTESGIPLARGFWQEFSNRLKHKLLPALQDEHDFLYGINRVFFRKDDYAWIEQVSRQTWITFFEKTGLPFSIENKKLRQQLLNSLSILSFQVTQLGLEKDIAKYLPGDISDNPFVQQNYRVAEIDDLLLHSDVLSSPSASIEKLKKVMQACEEAVAHIREQLASQGASINQTYVLLILAARLQRMQLLLDALDRDHHFDTGKLVDLFIVLVRNENRKNSLREFLSQGLTYMAYRIAEHKGKKGGKYITHTRKEYWLMIVSAMWGGFIISFIAIFKNLLGKLTLAPFWAGFFYSINYSVGFILIEQTQSTLATKQPAFTATAVANSLDTRRNDSEPNLHNLAVTVSKVSRSQIASFFGNLIVVFPFTFFLAWGYNELTGAHITNQAGAIKMLEDQHPWHSAALLYACFTGFFLFASGIIAGYVQNKIQYADIPERMEKHPLLRISLPPSKLKKFSSFIENYAGAFAGNIALGFFLGMSSTIDKIFSIPFDIRHITISAGNAAIAVYELGIRNIPPAYLATVFAGVLCIGLLNFLVSFSLAFFVALRSRGIRMRDYPGFFRILWRYFRHNPMDFIRPRKRLISEA